MGKKPITMLTSLSLYSILRIIRTGYNGMETSSTAPACSRGSSLLLTAARNMRMVRWG